MGLNYPKIRIVGIFLLFSSRHNVTSSPVEREPNGSEVTHGKLTGNGAMARISRVLRK